MLTFVSFKWRDPESKTQYTAEAANTLARMVGRHYHKPHRFVLITDDPAGATCETYPLWADLRGMRHPLGGGRPACYTRMKLFSREMRDVLGPRVVQMDLDVVITGDITELFERDAPFVGWRVTNGRKPRVYNGSLWMVTPGALDYVWSDFDPDVTPRRANAAGYVGSDQACMAYMLGEDRPYWTARDGVLSYRLDKLDRRALPAHARIVCFHGPKKPWHVTENWVREHYR